jgi:uncharacterized protein YecT (DUF1311 family)
LPCPAGQRRALADECSNANTQTEMNQCAAAQYQAADKKLNDTWQQALKRAAGKQQTLLKKRSRRGSPCATPTAPSSRPAPKAAACSRC